MRLFRPGILARLLYPNALFRCRTREKILYLTFDDGPDKTVTPAVIDVLDKHGVKAVFFCLGEAVESNPGLKDIITAHGHIVGNHGFLHLNGKKTDPDNYIRNAERASALTSGTLFRPPYGRLSKAQYKVLSGKFRIVLWDIMPYDFDKAFGGDNSLRILMRMIRPGSVIVLHDTVRSTVLSFLDRFISQATSRGYRFDIPSFSGKKDTGL